jgi:hypothetical protein
MEGDDTYDHEYDYDEIEFIYVKNDGTHVYGDYELLETDGTQYMYEISIYHMDPTTHAIRKSLVFNKMFQHQLIDIMFKHVVVATEGL